MNTFNQAKQLSGTFPSTDSATRSKIFVRNLQRTVPVNGADLEKFAARALASCLRIRRLKPTNLTRLHEIFVLLVSDRRMASLHRQFLHESGPTDVLTFQHGEIFISMETARRQARRFRSSLAQELRLYVVHGLLHLHGFDHGNEIDAGEMERVQKEILRSALSPGSAIRAERKMHDPASRCRL